MHSINRLNFFYIDIKLEMEIIEILILMASLCLPIWMGEVIDYVETLEDLFELLEKEEEITGCLQDYGLI